MKFSNKYMALLLVPMMALLIVAGDFYMGAEEPAPYYEILPASTIAVLTAPDMMELKGMIESPEVAEIMATFGVLEEAKENMEEARAEVMKETGMDIEALYNSLAGDFTVGLLDLNVMGGMPGIVGLIGMKDGDAAVNELLAKVNELYMEHEEEAIPTVDIAGVRALNIENQVYAFAHKGHLVITSTKGAAEVVLTGGDKLIDSDEFKMHFDKVRLSDGIGMYIDLKPVTAMLTPMMTMMEGSMAPVEGQPMSEEAFGIKMLKELKLDKIQSFSWKIPLLTDDRNSMYIHAPGYDGLLNVLFTGKPVGDIGKLLCPTTDMAVAIRLNDPANILDVALAKVSEFKPEVMDQYKGAMEMAKAETGIDIREEVINAFGDTMIIGYTLPEDGKLDPEADFPMNLFGAFRMQFVWTLNDGASLMNAMDKMLAMAAEKGEDVNAMIEKYNGHVIFAPPAGEIPFDLSVVLGEDSLRVVYAKPEMAKMMVDNLTSGKNLASKGWYQAAKAKIPASSNIVSMVSQGYLQKWNKISESMLEGVECEETRAALKALSAKSAASIAKYGDFYSYGTVTESGFYSEGSMPTKDYLYFFVAEVAKVFSAVDGGPCTCDHEEGAEHEHKAVH